MLRSRRPDGGRRADKRRRSRSVLKCARWVGASPYPTRFTEALRRRRRLRQGTAPPRPPTTGAARTPCTEDPVLAYSRSSGIAHVRTGAAHRTAARQIAGRSPTKPFSSRPSVSPCRSGVLILTASIRTGEHRFHEPLPVASRPGNLRQMWRAILGLSCSRTWVRPTATGRKGPGCSAL
jgi:hypothetical protein